jgi:hypothetical protein
MGTRDAAVKTAQLTGMIVTGIVTLGADVDVMLAMPLGIFAGALAMGFVAAAEARLEAKKRAAGQPPSAGILLSASSNSRKVG